MEPGKASSEFLDLLTKTIARALQVSVQYMLQHGVGAGMKATGSGKTQASRQSKFVASHSMVWLPGCLPAVLPASLCPDRRECYHPDQAARFMGKR